MCEHYDAIVVGSGFGGSVMTYRLAQAGMRVCLLERGKKYAPGDFPRTPHEMSTNFWDPSAGLHGLFNIWSFKGLDAVVASGLGGGSLIYANVLLRKDATWFVQDESGDPNAEDWPVTYSDLLPHYRAVERILRPRRYPVGKLPYQQTRKTIEFAKAVQQLDYRARRPPLGVIFGNHGHRPVPGEPIEERYHNMHGRQRRACTLCGECDIGCNSGSKNTLDHTYLSRAEVYGARIMARCEVVEIRPASSGGYSVAYVRRLPEDEGQQRKKSQLPVEHLAADQLILSAGALGTTHLLIQNKQHFSRISGRLGSRFSGNGDILTFARKRRFAAQPPDIFDAAHGPVITSMIKIPDQLDGGEGRGYYIEDAGFPVALSWMLHMIDLPGALLAALLPWLKFLVRHWTKWPDTDAGAEVAALFGHNRRSAGLLPLLGMGRDIPNGVMRASGTKIQLTRPWKKHNTKYFRRISKTMRRIAERMDAKFTRSLYHPFFRRSVTVHPLGGCPMGRSPERGVVDCHGEVFNYPGLFVADGSVMPGSVGPNPSLTIAALADRFADKVIENYTLRQRGL